MVNFYYYYCFFLKTFLLASYFFLPYFNNTLMLRDRTRLRCEATIPRPTSFIAFEYPGFLGTSRRNNILLISVEFIFSHLFSFESFYVPRFASSLPYSSLMRLYQCLRICRVPLIFEFSRLSLFFKSARDRRWEWERGGFYHNGQEYFLIYIYIVSFSSGVSRSPDSPFFSYDR